MFKETCHIDPRRTAGTPQKLGLEGPQTTVMVQKGEAVALGERKARVWREANRGWKRCGELWGWCSPFIGAGGASGRGGRGG
jgi:hypothetical protein